MSINQLAQVTGDSRKKKKDIGQKKNVTNKAKAGLRKRPASDQAYLRPSRDAGRKVQRAYTQIAAQTKRSAANPRASFLEVDGYGRLLSGCPARSKGISELAVWIDTAALGCFGRRSTRDRLDVWLLAKVFCLNL